MAHAIINSLERVIYVGPIDVPRLSPMILMFGPIFLLRVSHDIVSERVNHIPFSLMYNSKNDFKM